MSRVIIAIIALFIASVEMTETGILSVGPFNCTSGTQKSLNTTYFSGINLYALNIVPRNNQNDILIVTVFDNIDSFRFSSQKDASVIDCNLLNKPLITVAPIVKNVGGVVICQNPHSPGMSSVNFINSANKITDTGKNCPRSSDVKSFIDRGYVPAYVDCSLKEALSVDFYFDCSQE